MLVNHQADALAPVRKYAFTREYLHDPGYPEEDFNAVWRDVMEYGVPDQVSPFINGHRANTILTRQLDLVRNDQKPVADALAAAARQINEEILETVKRDPELHRTYCRLTGEDPL
jgi:ABC-type glycerol-3-phosphate transport system substrate-binding protein